MQDGALYAVAAEPILAAASLARRYPDLAFAAERQMKNARPDAAGLRAALQYPGRDALLAGPVAAALVYRSSDGGAGWTRVEQAPLSLALRLRAAVEGGGQDAATVRPPAKEPPRQRKAPPKDAGRGNLHALAPLAQGRYGGHGAPRQGPPGSPQQMILLGALSPETLLAFVDPQRLLARFNGAAPLTLVSGDAAIVPTQQGWDALVSALVTESESEGEISLGPAQADAAFELLRSQGAAWTAGAALPAGSPRSLAAAGAAVYVVRDDGRAFRIAP